MPAILKRTFSAISNRWKALAWIFVAILLALALVLVLRKFPTLRIPTTAVAVSVFLILLLWQFPKWQVRSVVGLDSKDHFDRENEARKTLSQILGGLVLLIGFYFTWQNLVVTREGQVEAEKATQENLRIASEGQITDRFTKAIAQLEDAKLEIRLGGIFGLERISKESSKDHLAVMEIQTAYVREHAKLTRPQRPPPKTPNDTPRPAPDIQAILTVLGRRTLTYKNGEEQRLDLHETDLRGANLYNADLSGANLSKADLTQAILSGAKLGEVSLFAAKLIEAELSRADLSKALLTAADFTGADLARANLKWATLSRNMIGNPANLSGAFFEEADLSGAKLGEVNLRGSFLNNAILVGAQLGYANLEGSSLNGANLSGAHLIGANLKGASGLSSDQLESAKGDAYTMLPPGIPRPKSWPR